MTEDLPLAGLKVIDCASFIAAPVATTVLADFGADVIKIEPPTGEPYRRDPTTQSVPPSPYPYNYIVDNRSKRAITLDLKIDAGRQVLHRMLADTDVFVTNAPFPARERLQVRYQDLKDLYPRLIYASVTAYGETGPEADRTGFDSTALWARTGLMDLCKPAPDSAPARSLPGMGDHPTAISMVAAIMTALYRRERTGKGGEVATNLMANGLWWNAIWTQAALCGAKVEARPPREEADNPLHNLYSCADGRWFHLVMITKPDRFYEVARAIGLTQYADDPRMGSVIDRKPFAPELIDAFDAVFKTKTWPEWKQILTDNRFTFGEIGTVDDVATDVQMRESGTIIPHPEPERAGADLTLSSPFWLTDVEKRPPTMSPGLGEHNDEVLSELGFGADEAKALRDAGAFG
ncbi:MAG: CaiB/BaiF CoA transferase family protein [Alphaproteobacteria bacterium]|jgi:formyl-CoA transferase